MIYICNFHVLSHLLLIFICKLHWNISLMHSTLEEASYGGHKTFDAVVIQSMDSLRTDDTVNLGMLQDLTLCDDQQETAGTCVSNSLYQSTGVRFVFCFLFLYDLHTNGFLAHFLKGSICSVGTSDSSLANMDWKNLSLESERAGVNGLTRGGRACDPIANWLSGGTCEANELSSDTLFQPILA
jgi:hypothetical protein